MWFTSARCSYWRIRMSWSANFRYNWCNSELWTFLYHSPYPNYHTLTSKWAFKRVLKILFTPIPGTHQNHVYRPPFRVLANHHPSSYICVNPISRVSSGKIPSFISCVVSGKGHSLAQGRGITCSVPSPSPPFPLIPFNRMNVSWLLHVNSILLFTLFYILLYYVDVCGWRGWWVGHHC